MSPEALKAKGVQLRSMRIVGTRLTLDGVYLHRHASPLFFFPQVAFGSLND